MQYIINELFSEGVEDTFITYSTLFYVLGYE